MLDENDNGTIASTGRMRYSSVSTAKPRKRKYHARSTSEVCGANNGFDNFMLGSDYRLGCARVKRPYTAYNTSVAASSRPPSAQAMPQLIVTFVK